jgi:nucleoside-diphosphate-sugar epimerase
MKNFLVVGAGGFIAGHLVNRLLREGCKVTAVDIKPLEFWFQKFDKAQNYNLDMSDYINCEKMTENVDYVLNLACNMGGIGFIENNKAECMLSVLINTHLLKACLKNKVKKYFFSSSACAYNTNLQKNPNIEGLKEEDAYPAMPEDGYGWEKLFSERMCRHFTEDFKLETRVARFHNIYGPYGTFDGGREKAPAALCRKVIEAKIHNKKNIEVWGDGNQTRSFLYIDDCIDAILKLFHSNFKDPINIGSEEKVSINQLIDIIENIANIKLKREYQLDKPKGVNGRSSNNDLIKKVLNWNYNYSLKEGIEKTYHWINQLYQNKNNNSFIKFTKK